MIQKIFTWFKNWYLYGTIAIGYLVYVTFPGWYLPISTGLDNSWIYAINYLPNSSYLFGRDVVFSWGPLGHLLLPQNLGNNIANSMIFLITMHSLFTLSLFYFLYREKRKLQVILFVASYLIVYVLLYWALREYSLLLILGLLLGISFDSNKIIKYTSASLCGVLAGLLLFIKISLGMGAFAMLIVYAIIVIARQRQQSWRILLAGGITYLTTVLITAFAFMKSLPAIIQWFIYNIEIVNGYGAAMSVVGPIVIVMLGVLSLIIYLTLVLVLWKQKAQPLFIALIFIVPAFMAFKHSFCRHDAPHQPIFFAFLLAILCVLILNAVGKKGLITCIAGFFILLAVTIPVIHPNINYLAADTADFLQGKRGWSNISSILHSDDLRQRLDEQSKTNLAANKLPSEIVDIIKSDGGTVDILPWEISYCPANSLEWNPNPVLQIYSAYTARLDQWSASHYEGNRAPEFLIVEFMDIDGRHPLLGAPSTWRSVIANYGLILADSPAGRLLLKRNMQPAKRTITVMKQENAYINQWIVVPPSHNLLFVNVDMRLTFLGAAAKTLFRIPPVHIDLIYNSGRGIMSYRIIPDTAKNGLLINFLPSTVEELSKLFTGVANDRVAQFRISGPGTIYYGKEISLTWKEMSYPMTLERLNPQELTFAGKDALYSVDTISGRLLSQQASPIVINAQREETVTISGWAVDQHAGKTAGGVFITINDRIDIPAIYGLDRPDVAEHFKNPHYRFSGFSASFATAVLGKGQHVLSLKIVTADKNSYYEPDQKIILEVRY